MLQAILMSIKNLFSHPAGSEYQSHLVSGIRGQIRVYIEECDFCGNCGASCPVQAIEVNSRKRCLEIDWFQCILCGSCTETCTRGCLIMDNCYKEPSCSREKQQYIR